MRPDARAASILALLGVAAAAACGGRAVSQPAGVDGGGSPGASGSSSGGSGGSSGGSAGGASSGGVAPREPQNHRPSDAPCSTPVPPGGCSVTGHPFGDAGCSADTDCVGDNARCHDSLGGPAICFCTSDVCAHDSDCPASEACACHGTPYTLGLGNACQPGNCRVDADCGAGGYCSPSLAATSCGLLAGYYCHTATDLCVDDGDCPPQTGQMCMYSKAGARWECQSQTIYGCPI